MVKKTLLSLAIAASTAGLTACNISSTTENNAVDSDPVKAGQPGQGTSFPAVIFAAASGTVPVANDFLFAEASTTDGTANTSDTAPPVTTAINKLDGFSTIAAHYINFNTALDSDTVIAGQTVFLIKLKNSQDNPAIDALNLTTIVDPANSGASPFASDQPFEIVDGAAVPHYEANYITLDNGDTHAIQILPKTPLDAKSKYIVVLTNSLKTSGGEDIAQSSEYKLVSGNDELFTASLIPVRTAVQAWESLAAGYLAVASSNTITQDDILLSYAFTTTGTTDVLHAMTAPGTFLTTQIPTVAHAEGAISAKVSAATYAATIAGAVDPENPTAEEIATAEATATATVAGTLLAIAQGTAMKINASTGAGIPIDSTTRDVLLASEQFSPYYYAGLIGVIADGSGAGLDTIVDKPQSRTYTPIISAAATPVAVPYDTLLTAQITPKVEAATPDIATAEGAISLGLAEGGADQATIDATLLGIAQTVATGINTEAGSTVVPIDANTRTVLIASETLAPIYLGGLRTAIVTGQVTALSSGGAIYQGGLTIPNFLPNSQAGIADKDLGSWSGSNNAALALGLEGAPTDKNGEINVTYRFPYADKLGNNTVPVMVTMPKADCDPDGAGPAAGKPTDGWPVVIYQHGITVDRTAGILVGNTLAGQCIAMVAIDHVMHGIAPLNGAGEASSLRSFNIEQVAATDAATNSPFAAARAGIILAAGAENVPELAAMAERHNNVGKAADQSNVDMVFQGALDSDGNAVTADSIGASADLYINLNEFSRTRDAIRQTVLDMLNLSASIGDMDVNADGTADELDPAKIYFIGHSLGGIVGTTFLAVSNNSGVRTYNTNLPAITAAALGNPGGGFVKLLENSPSIGAKVLAGLAASGVEQGSETIEKFLAVFQAMVDSADPINFTADTLDIPVLVYTDVGGLAAEEGEADDGALSDQVVPNNALTPVTPSAKSFLAGTDPLVTEMGITSIVNQATAVVGGPITADPQYYFPNAANDSIVRANIRFAKGTHSTFSSADPQDVFAETYQQIITYFDPYGATVLLGLPGDQKGFIVENTEILEAAE
jgi:hypothetical protein